MKIQAINTGILSFGFSGSVFHAPFIHCNPHFNLTAVVERTKKAAQAIYPTLKSYATVDELLADESIELVVVNTPNYTHLDYASQALQAGKHVLLEKPAVENSAELEQLYTLSLQTGKKLYIYQNKRFDSHFMQVKQVVESGVLGDIIELHIRFDRYKMELGQKDFKESNKYASSGVVYDLGPHVIDQAISLFGKPLSAAKTTASNRVGSQVDDYFHYHLRYANNLQVFLTANLLVADPQTAFIVHGTKGSFSKAMADVQEDQLLAGIMPSDSTYGIEQEDQAGKLVTIASDGKKSTSILPPLKGDYGLLFDALYQDLREGIPYPIKIEEVKWQIDLLTQ